MHAPAALLIILLPFTLATQRLPARTPAAPALLPRQRLIPCADQGRPFCGTDEFACIPAGSTCCDFGGSCPAGFVCDVPAAGESGEAGCCPEGEDCSQGGGTGGAVTGTVTLVPVETTMVLEPTAPPRPTEEGEGIISIPAGETPIAGTEPTSVSAPDLTTTVPDPTSVAGPVPTGTATGTGTGILPPSNGTVPSATAAPSSFEGAAGRGAVPTVMAIGAVAVAALFL
ncbi:hypothetical protein EDC01DRAFT_629841 [Geopyxis carbonaria]|nr:hypothetical protein EDC01DRAFT_629841 [Geopyxis carbonaria]